MGLFSEFRRRNVFRMAALYVVAAWLIMQVAEVIITLGDLPSWMGRVLLVVLGIGFPIVLTFSWFYELTPSGPKLDSAPDVEAAGHDAGGRQLDFIVIAVLSAALLVFSADKWWPRGPAAASLAVLPFANMSQDPDQEYFSDGMSEELMGVLSGIPEILVISRTSAFSFKGKGFKSKDIARELNVAHVLDGSVRISENRVRVQAQLIDARSDMQTWSKSFDREFSDIFAIQEEIAVAVARELKVRFVDLSSRITETSPDAYALYLKAQYLAHDLTPESLQQSNELFRKVLDLDPGFAPAWDGLANNYQFQAGYGLVEFEEGFRMANDAIDRAIAIDPGLGHPHALRGRIARGVDYDLAAAARHYERALELDSRHDDSIRGAAVLLLSLDRVDEALVFNEYAVRLDPVNPIGYGNLGMGYMLVERWDDALAACRKSLALSPALLGARFCVGSALLFRGDAKLAAEEFEQEGLESLRLVGLTMAWHALGDTAKSNGAMAELVDKYSDSWAAQIAYAYDFLGEVDKAFEWLDKAVKNRDPGVTEILSGSQYFSYSRRDPRWLPFLTKIGFAPDQLAAIEFDIAPP